MATYFIDPYKKYYEKLSTAASMTTSASKIAENSENVVSIISRLQSQIETALWEELGYKELVTTSIPGLKTRTDLLKNNIVSGLVVACDKSINSLLPILEKLKSKDEEYEKNKSELNALSEPSNKYVTEYNKITGKYKETNQYTEEYSKYLSEKNRLETLINTLEQEIKNILLQADNEISTIKALNGGVQDFDSTNATGVILEIQGLTLSDAEKAFIEALEKSITEYAEEEGVSYEEQLTQLSGLYPTGKTVLYNDAGGYEYGYSRQILTSHGKLVTVFQQAWNSKEKKYRYQDVANDPKSLSSAGCGYNALASIMSSKYPNITPEQLFLEMGRKSLYSSDIKEHLESTYGIKVGYREGFPTNERGKITTETKKAEIIKEVMKGNMVICTVDGRTDYKYTRNGHWVSIVDYDPATDSFYVTDSNDQDDSNAGPIDATRFLNNYEINSNIIYIADDSGYKDSERYYRAYLGKNGWQNVIVVI